ncbi:hypothetical protein NGRA_0680 [Nosema granulosis]|uniref:Apoptosis-antagonizing transcription factor C-terminal domain-containing protein n=1 Tax=Nosema granulosis TaxID=83296 RepID=A0A9P6KZC3_9MICR|nr:hypothetical protein NGRA_0680 [Nosema granulosis]
MKNINVLPNEKEEISGCFKQINNIIEDLEVIRKSPVLVKDIKDTCKIISEEEQKEILKDAIKSIEDMSYYLRFEESEAPVELFRNLEKIVNKEVKRIGKLDFKALDKIIKKKHQCVSFLDRTLIDKKMKSKEVNFEYCDKLTGFLTKKGRFRWNDEKIDELFISLMK